MSAVLRQLLREEITKSGPISFARYMQRSLYEPNHGYYARGINRTGRHGDFITNVSIGPCYGQLLASHIVQAWQQFGRPAAWHLIEQGANDGQLMQDILTWIQQEHPDCHAAAQPHFIEPLETARQAQSTRVPHAYWHATLPARLGSHGIYYCNELLDAFPIQRLRYLGNGNWVEMRVTHDPATETFLWADTPSAFPSPPADLPTDFIIEHSPSLLDWTAEISQLFDTGQWIITDYGLREEEFFAPTRRHGTLRGYHHHQLIAEDLLNHPGEIDLTAHVNWTQIGRLSQQHGLEVHTPLDQARFLIPLAVPFLRQIERPGEAPSPHQLRWLRQFQTLTHPAQLGTKFQTLVLTKAPTPLHR